MPHTPANPGQERVSVLVADDDPIMRNLIATRIMRLKGQTTEAEDGAAAWDLLTRQSFDIALVDLNMPNLDGIALIQCMRGHPRTRHMPIVVITSQDDAVTLAAALGAGATAFLTKPVNWTTFEYYLTSLLQLSASDRKARTATQFAQAVSRSKTALLEGLSSQVNASAERLRTRLEHIRKGVTTEGPASLLDASLAEVEELIAAADRAMRFSDMVSKNINADDRAVSLDGLLNDVVCAASADAKARGVALALLNEAPGRALRCDETSVAVAIGELLNNGIAHSNGGTTITLKLSSYPDGEVGIEVADQGCGMHPEFISRIFEGHYLGGKAARSGFGLPLAKAVAQAHGGSLEVRSMPGQGTAALILLPPDRIVPFLRVVA